MPARSLDSSLRPLGRPSLWTRVRPLALPLAMLVGTASTASAQVSVEAALGVTPKQPDVPYDQPEGDEVKQCTIKLEKFGQGSGYAVSGPNGQPLRQLIDTSGDNNLNQFRYFQLGLETYRETNTDKDAAIEEYRWLNTAGTRWGVDTNGDRTIDVWRRISAEEATREAVAALAAGDAERMMALMFTARDAQTLQLDGDIAKKLVERASDVEAQMKEALATRQINRSTTWERSDSAMLMPVLIPAESGKADKDVIVYENVTAVARTGEKDVFLDVGEVIQVGDAWKLTRVPRPLDPTQQLVTDGGLLLQPVIGSMPTPEDFSKEMRALLTDLEAMGKRQPNLNDRDEATKWNVERAKLLDRIIAEAGSREQKAMFMQQQIDGITAAAQLGSYPEPLATLRKLEKDVAGDFPEFESYVTFRRIEVESGERAREAGTDTKKQTAALDWLLKELDGFVRKFPKSNDAATAMWTLGYQYELAGNVKRAREWYEVAAKQFGQTPPGEKSAGALQRLALAGNKITLSGETLDGGQLDLAQYRGKVVAVVFWATWSAPFTEAVPELLELRQEYGRNGFEIVGVNLDNAGAPVEQYVKEQKVAFPSVASGPAGMDSPVGRKFGIVQVPTIMLVDKSGTVVDASASVDSLRTQVPRLLLRR